MFEKVLIIFAVLYLLINLIYSLLLLLHIAKFKVKEKARVYLVAPTHSFIFAIIGIVIGAENLACVFFLKSMINIVFVALCAPAVNIIMLSILLVSRNSFFIQDKTYHKDGIVNVRYGADVSYEYQNKAVQIKASRKGKEYFKAILGPETGI